MSVLFSILSLRFSTFSTLSGNKTHQFLNLGPSIKHTYLKEWRGSKFSHHLSLSIQQNPEWVPVEMSHRLHYTSEHFNFTEEILTINLDNSQIHTQTPSHLKAKNRENQATSVKDGSQTINFLRYCTSFANLALL